MKKNKLVLFIPPFLFIGLLIFSIFGNIGHPLMWGDEAETATYAQRILKYGYPKVHDGKNSLNVSGISGVGTGVREELDMHTVSVWGQYYFAAIGEKIAQNYSDLYTKTAILRSTFALTGLVGILVLPVMFIYLFKNNRKNILLAFGFYLFINLLSVSLILHIREVRSYSLSILFSGLNLLVFYIYYFEKKINHTIYILLLVLFLTLLANSFPPGYLAITLSLIIYLVWEAYKNNKERFFRSLINKYFILSILPIVISIVLFIPVYLFFQTSQTSYQAYLDIGYDFSVYLRYMARIIIFLAKYHLLYLAIYLKVIYIFIFRKNINYNLSKISNLSKFLTIIFFTNLISLPLTPFMFDRYFVFMQPLLSMIVAVDLILIYELIVQEKLREGRGNFIYFHHYTIFLLILLSQITNFDNITGHIYELTHTFEGPVDKIVYYIKENFEDTEKLTIYSNAESTSYIYYLGSRVVCDETSNCYDQPPDIFIPRRYLLGDTWLRRYESYLESIEYQAIYLSILDYPSNNIPEFSLSLKHLYKTPLENDPTKQVILYIRKS